MNGYFRPSAYRQERFSRTSTWGPEYAAAIEKPQPSFWRLVWQIISGATR